MSKIFNYVPKDLKTKLVEILSVLADAKYMFLYPLAFWILQCIFIVKLSMSSLKKMNSLVSNIRHPTHSLARVLLNFVILFRANIF